MQTQDIALWILEPGCLLGTQHADMLDRFQARIVVVGELHAARLQLLDRPGDVAYLEADCGVLGLGAFGFRKQRDFGPAAAIDELPVRLEPPRLEPQAFFVEAARARQVLDRKHASDLRTGNRRHGFLRGGKVKLAFFWTGRFAPTMEKIAYEDNRAAA